MTKMLPVSACQMPACAARRDGKLVRKSHDRRPAPSRQTSQISAASDAERQQQDEQRQRLEASRGRTRAARAVSALTRTPRGSARAATR